MRGVSVGFLIIIVCAIFILTPAVAIGSSAQQPVIRFMTRQAEATTASDMVVRARVENARRAELRFRLDQGQWEQCTLQRVSGDLFMGSVIVPYGARSLEYFVWAQGRGGHTSSPVQEVALVDSVAPAWLPEEGKPGVLTETTKKRYFYDAQAHDNMVNGYDLTQVCDVVGLPYSGSWPGVNSKCNQSRTDGVSNPHTGLDLNMAAGRAVYAVMGGKIREADDMTDPVCYFLLIGHDPDGDGSDEFLTRYVHLNESSVPAGLKVVGTSVSKGAYLGNVASGTGNNHLHLEYVNSKTSNYRLPQYLFWMNKTGVNPQDADFIVRPTDNGAGKVTVVAYGWDNTQIVHLGSSAVHIHYRVYPSTTWTERVMSKSGDTYTYTITNKGDIEYYISARRYADTSIVAYRPAYWNTYGTSSPYNSPPPPEYFYMFVP